MCENRCIMRLLSNINILLTSGNILNICMNIPCDSITCFSCSYRIFFFFLSYFMYCVICIYFNRRFNVFFFQKMVTACVKWRRICKTYLEELYIVKRLCGLEFVCVWTVCFYTASWVWIYYLSTTTMIGFGGSWLIQFMFGNQL